MNSSVRSFILKWDRGFEHFQVKLSHTLIWVWAVRENPWCLQNSSKTPWLICAWDVKFRTITTTMSFKKRHNRVLHCWLYPCLSLITLTLKERIRSDEKHFEQHEISTAQCTHKSNTHTHTQSSHRPMQNRDIENSSGGIEHSVTPRTLMKVHVGENTMHISYLLTHPHRYVGAHRHTLIHCRQR